MTTETRNQSTMNLDQMTPLEIVAAMNIEDKKVPVAIEKVLPQIAELVSVVEEAFQKGARLFYIDEDGGSVKAAVTMILAECDVRTANELMKISNGHVREAVKSKIKPSKINI